MDRNLLQNICGALGGCKMADKEVTEKTSEVYNDVFADIMKVLLFYGKGVVRG